MPVKKLTIVVLHESNIFSQQRADEFALRIDPFINNPNFFSVQFVFRGDIFVAIIVLQTIV